MPIKIYIMIISELGCFQYSMALSEGILHNEFPSRRHLPSHNGGHLFLMPEVSSGMPHLMDRIPTTSDFLAYGKSMLRHTLYKIFLLTPKYRFFTHTNYNHDNLIITEIAIYSDHGNYFSITCQWLWKLLPAGMTSSLYLTFTHAWYFPQPRRNVGPTSGTLYQQ